MSFVLRFICCASAKAVKEEEKDEERHSDQQSERSPRFGQPSKDNVIEIPNKSPDDTTSFTAITDNTRKNQSNSDRDAQRANSFTPELRPSLFTKDKSSTWQSHTEDKYKMNSDPPQEVNNISVMSIQPEENPEGTSRNTGTFNHKSEERKSIGLAKFKSETSVPMTQPTSANVLKGGVVMKKVDRSRENQSTGLSEENIFQARAGKRRASKREDLNSTPILKSATLSTIKHI